MTERRKLLARLILMLVGIGVAVTAWVLVAWFRGAPERRCARISLRTIHIAGFISSHVDDHGAPPFAATGTHEEYLGKLVEAEDLGPEFLLPKLEEAGRHCVLVNLRPEEWAAVKAYVEANAAEGTLRLLAGWVGDRAAGRRRLFRRVMVFHGSSSADEAFFRTEVLAMAEAVREALGKSLVDCLIYSEGDFDPSTLGAQGADDAQASDETERRP